MTDGSLSTSRSVGWTAAEYFAGIGLASEGLAKGGVNVVWSNDISPVKQRLFSHFFGADAAHRYLVGDLGELEPEDLPAPVDIAWASFPCTDLSVAGTRAGLHKGPASSTFWHFIKVLSKLGADRPTIVALENVSAFATSHSGRDIASAIQSLNGLGYSVDVLNIDARHFVPQSRPRLFLVGVRGDVLTSDDAHEARPGWLQAIFQDHTLRTHKFPLPSLPAPLTDGLDDYVEQIDESDGRWWDEVRVGAYIASLSPLQHARLEELRSRHSVTHRTAYRRMRLGIPRWEMRADGISGCLRTARGGSSKQAVVQVGNNQMRVRWMTPIEYARLMGMRRLRVDGLLDQHVYSAFGDAVCAPVVEWLTTSYFVPMLQQATAARYGERAASGY